MSVHPETAAARVVTLGELDTSAVASLLMEFGLELIVVPLDGDIPATYWGAPEAGIASRVVFARADTPMHSLLHEASHIICMTSARRSTLWRDAGGDDAEESAVCYLQVLLADELAGLDASRVLADLDAWGYTFREGSASAWFAGDGCDARAWLLAHELIDARSRPTRRLRA